jgi:hypothetical protein
MLSRLGPGYLEALKARSVIPRLLPLKENGTFTGSGICATLSPVLQMIKTANNLFMPIEYSFPTPAA